MCVGQAVQGPKKEEGRVLFCGGRRKKKKTPFVIKTESLLEELCVHLFSVFYCLKSQHRCVVATRRYSTLSTYYSTREQLRGRNYSRLRKEPSNSL